MQARMQTCYMPNYCLNLAWTYLPSCSPHVRIYLYVRRHSGGLTMLSQAALLCNHKFLMTITGTYTRILMLFKCTIFLFSKGNTGRTGCMALYGGRSSTQPLLLNKTSFKKNQNRITWAVPQHNRWLVGAYKNQFFRSELKLCGNHATDHPRVCTWPEDHTVACEQQQNQSLFGSLKPSKEKAAPRPSST